MDYEKEQLERKLRNAKEAHRTDLFIIYWIIGLIALIFVFGTENFAYSIGAWLVVFIAWKVSNKQVKDE
jgi:hypothetical protein